MVVTGEAGVGKTALVSVGVAWRWCGPARASSVHRPPAGARRYRLKTVGELATVIQRRGPRVLRLLEELRRTPTLMVIEDVHWADEATLNVMPCSPAGWQQRAAW